jgi:hypothetical protein
VFGVDRPPEGESIMPTVMPRYCTITAAPPCGGPNTRILSGALRPTLNPLSYDGSFELQDPDAHRPEETKWRQHLRRAPDDDSGSKIVTRTAGDVD